MTMCQYGEKTKKKKKTTLLQCPESCNMTSTKPGAGGISQAKPKTSSGSPLPKSCRTSKPKEGQDPKRKPRQRKKSEEKLKEKRMGTKARDSLGTHRGDDENRRGRGMLLKKSDAPPSPESPTKGKLATSAYPYEHLH